MQYEIAHRVNTEKFNQLIRAYSTFPFDLLIFPSPAAATDVRKSVFGAGRSVPSEKWASKSYGSG